MKRKEFKLGKSFYHRANWSEFDHYQFRMQIIALKWIGIQLKLRGESTLEFLINSVVNYLESFDHER